VNGGLQVQLENCRAEVNHPKPPDGGRAYGGKRAPSRRERAPYGSGRLYGVKEGSRRERAKELL